MAKSIESKTDQNTTDILLMKKDISYIKNSVDEIQTKLDQQQMYMSNTYVRKSDFQHLKREVIGLLKVRDWVAGIVIFSVIAALLGLVLIQ